MTWSEVIDAVDAHWPKDKSQYPLPLDPATYAEVMAKLRKEAAFDEVARSQKEVK